MPDGTATAHLYRPKLATVLTEGYGLEALRKDALAALTVAIGLVRAVLLLDDLAGMNHPPEGGKARGPHATRIEYLLQDLFPKRSA